MRDLQEQGIAFLFDMRKLTFVKIDSTTQVRAGLSRLPSVVHQKEVILFSPSLVLGPLS